MAVLQESFICSIRVGTGCGSNKTNNVLGCGAGALCSTFGCNNVAIGKASGGGNSTCFNVSIGAYAGRNSQGKCNVFIGLQSGCGNTSTGSTNNVLIGSCTRVTNCTFETVAIGFCALRHGGDAHRSVSIGYLSMCSSSAGNNNVAIGRGTLQNNSGSDNVAVGYLSAQNTGNGVKQVSIGDRATRFGSSGYNNRVQIGFYTYEQNYRSNSTALGRYAVTYAGVYGNWYDVSDTRDKTDITPLNENLGINFIRKLRPVSYKFDHRKAYVNKCGFEWGEKDGTLKETGENYGFLAQEVSEAAKELNAQFDAVKKDPILDKYEISNLEFLPSIVKAIQYLNLEIDEIEKRLTWNGNISK